MRVKPARGLEGNALNLEPRTEKRRRGDSLKSGRIGLRGCFVDEQRIWVYVGTMCI